MKHKLNNYLKSPGVTNNKPKGTNNNYIPPFRSKYFVEKLKNITLRNKQTVLL